MDRNTITGIILIFAIFIGFSIYNNSRSNKGYEKAVGVAESSYAKGDLETARTEYINALRFKPTQQDAIARLSEINLKLGIVPETLKKDTILTQQAKTEIAVPSAPGTTKELNQYGIFAQAATGDNEFAVQRFSYRFFIVND